MTTSAYDKVTHDGKVVDRVTHEALLVVERRLGYPLTITQGSYSTSVAASGGTHSGGGVVDLTAYDWQNKVRVMRAVGFAAWHRPAREGVWPEHIHAVLVDTYPDRLAWEARAQIADYYKGLDGLASHDPDPFPRPNPIPVFQWAPDRRTRGAHVDAALDHLERSFAAAGTLRDAKINQATVLLREIAWKITNTPYKDGLTHPLRDTGSRGPQIDAALDHIRKALLVALGTRRSLLTAARDALREIPVG